MAQREKRFHYLVVPSAVLADVLPLIVPLFAVTSMSVSESYHLPPIGLSQQRVIVAAHEDTVMLSGLLIGPSRFTLKFMLEIMADLSKRGTAIERMMPGRVSGLVLVTAMTIGIAVQMQPLTFAGSAARRDLDRRGDARESLRPEQQLPARDRWGAGGARGIRAIATGRAASRRPARVVVGGLERKGA